MDSKGLAMLQEQMKTPNVGRVDSTASVQMETKILIIMLIISNIWVCVVILRKHLDVFVSLHPYPSCTKLQPPRESFLPLLSGTVAHFPLYCLHLPAQSQLRTVTSEHYLST